MIVIDIETIAIPNAPMPDFSAPGNLKDPVKIAAAIEEKKANWLADGALHAERGQVVAIGWRNLKERAMTLTGPEPELLSAIWEVLRGETLVVGFNLHRFDLPFLIRRAWVNGVHVPMGSIFRNGRIDENRFVDLLKLWQCGDRQEYISLDMMARTLLGRGKTGSGADFGNLWAADRQAALEYCKADVDLTWDCALRMGVI